MNFVLGIAIFISGLLMGAALYRVFFTDKSGAEKLNKELDETQAEYANLQNNVDLHFQKMAALVNTLTQSYSDVHQHLAEGAQNISRHPIPTDLISNQKLETPSLSQKIAPVSTSQETKSPTKEKRLENTPTQENPKDSAKDIKNSSSAAATTTKKNASTDLDADIDIKKTQTETQADNLKAKK